MSSAHTQSLDASPFGRPPVLPACPACGGRLLVVSTSRHGHCVCRHAVCAACGKKARQVETSSGHVFFVRNLAGAGSPPERP